MGVGRFLLQFVDNPKCNWIDEVLLEGRPHLFQLVGIQFRIL